MAALVLSLFARDNFSFLLLPDARASGDQPTRREVIPGRKAVGRGSANMGWARREEPGALLCGCPVPHTVLLWGKGMGWEPLQPPPGLAALGRVLQGRARAL